jgi:hypothetical protein
MVAKHAPQAPRTPFVLLVLGMLGGGLIVLLLLNSAAAADAFTQKRLRQQSQALSLREQQLSREVAASEAPGALAARAQSLGMVPAGEQGFIVLQPDGSARIAGSPVPATSPPPPPKPTPSPSVTAATPSGAARPASTPVPRDTPAARTMPTPMPPTSPKPSSPTTPAPGGTR